MRISKFPMSRFCACVIAPVKFRGLCHICFFNCLFVFVGSYVETSFKAVPKQIARVAINNTVVPDSHG